MTSLPPLITTRLRRLPPDAQPARRSGVGAAALEVVRPIIDDVRTAGLAAVRRHAQRLGDTPPDGSLVIERPALLRALDELDRADRALLERAAERIRAFAEAQRAAIGDTRVQVPGGWIAHRVTPVDRAGCYAPGGRYPLPSSVLMTAVTARAAGVRSVWVASPRPQQVTMAAAAIAGADALLSAGGAQAIAALAYGASDPEHGGPQVPACDVVCGPGNRYVTAAKQLVSADVGIDLIAGPSEVLIIADASARPAVIAADMLAQCEHDADASAVLVTTHGPLVEQVEAELERQLQGLPTQATARRALENSAALVVGNLEDAALVADRFAPEHLQVVCVNAEALLDTLRHFGGLFLGEGAAEVVGDYGVGPNHTLPTGGTARSTSGLSVMSFLRLQTIVSLDAARTPPGLYQDTARFARLEGLEAHARAAERRLGEGGC